jgi:hypothetical protein
MSYFIFAMVGVYVSKQEIISSGTFVPSSDPRKTLSFPAEEEMAFYEGRAL